MEYLKGNTAGEKLAFAQESSDPVVMYRAIEIYADLPYNDKDEVIKLVRKAVLKVADDRKEIKRQIELAKETNDAIRLHYLKHIMDVGRRALYTAMDGMAWDSEIRAIISSKRGALEETSAITRAANKIERWKYKKPTRVKISFTKDDIDNFKDTRLIKNIKISGRPGKSIYRGEYYEAGEEPWKKKES